MNSKEKKLSEFEENWEDIEDYLISFISNSESITPKPISKYSNFIAKRKPNNHSCDKGKFQKHNKGEYGNITEFMLSTKKPYSNLKETNLNLLDKLKKLG